MTDWEKRANEALDFLEIGVPDGDHHKAWIIDQTVRILTGCPTEHRIANDVNGAEYGYEALGESVEYRAFLDRHNEGEDGAETYSWDEGIAP